MTNRYALRMEQPDSWTIFDVFTGQPVELKHQVMVGMNKRDADAMVDRLNSRDVKRRAKANRKP
ncbi:hypothetical protein OHD62_30135 [Mesorhizobium sp. YC-39]|uniref:hypothetical protein n=1 Tax=unclassified Mesorhizobium TaxID=325217 RepID=UPI0021E75212|nr:MULTISPECIES: hypothetical protein [unclassified Mesorhizobium]MCV3210447.1 hypothetical protein [Mesorhizobium sp. YC-2]MCV3232655.1 hypothetical protein [Mesorhizobium sp. YC-39]